MTIVVTGSAGGIGRAVVARLEAAGHRVVGVDVRDAEIEADLATPAGRAAMVEAVTAATGGSIDGLVAGAGIRGDDGGPIVRVNHFGAVGTLDGLLPLLAAGSGGAAVAIVSNSATTQPGVPMAVVDACLAGDEDAAADLAAPDGLGAYAATKLALARWVRRAAVTPAWIGAGVRLNAVAPGFIDTPMTADIGDFVLSLGEIYPIPLGRTGRPEEIAATIAFLLSDDSSLFCGSVLTVDGGTDAALRADDWPAPI